MNKRDLINEVANDLSCPQAHAERVINAWIGGVGTGLKKDGRVQLVGFGTFTTRKRAARMGRNPQTGEQIRIKASKTVGFRPGKELKKYI